MITQILWPVFSSFHWQFFLNLHKFFWNFIIDTKMHSSFFSCSFLVGLLIRSTFFLLVPLRAPDSISKLEFSSTSSLYCKSRLFDLLGDVWGSTSISRRTISVLSCLMTSGSSWWFWINAPFLALRTSPLTCDFLHCINTMPYPFQRLQIRDIFALKFIEAVSRLSLESSSKCFVTVWYSPSLKSPNFVNLSQELLFRWQLKGQFCTGFRQLRW